MTRRTLGAAGGVLLLAATLAACSDDNSTEDAAVTELATAEPAPTAGNSAPTRDYTDVDVADYTTGSLVSWTLEGPGVDCYINTHSSSDSMGCTLDFAEDVRDASNGEAAGAVDWVPDGRFEPAMQTGGGDTPASVKTLRPGQRISAAGATCVASGDRAMACEREGKEFTYDDGDFSATGWTPGERNLVEGSRNVGGFCGEANNGLYADMWNTRVIVTKGTVDCREAVDTLDGYLSTWQDGSRGNTLLTTLSNGWTCSMPTAATSRADNVRVSCGKGSMAVKIPVSTPGAPSA